MKENVKKHIPYNRPLQKLPFGGLTSNMLRIIAVIFMVSDHLWASAISLGFWMTYIGRIALPIFAFQIAEGYVHTSDIKKYVKRLMLFAIISEIPFDLFCADEFINPYHQNVLFTFLLGLFAIILIDNLRKKVKEKTVTKKTVLITIISLLLIPLVSILGFVDYGFWGVVIVIMFYLLRDFPFAWLAQLVAMVVINIFIFEGLMIELELFGKAFEIPAQSFAVLSLIPIWLYGGKKGRSSKVMQYGFYAFYPAHMLVLYLITRFA